MEICNSPDRKIQARFCWDHCCSRGEQNQTTVSHACLLAAKRSKLVPYVGMGRVGPGVRPQGWHMVALCAGGMSSNLLLLQMPCLCSGEGAVGFCFGFFSLYFIVHDLPQLPMHVVIFSPS